MLENIDTPLLKFVNGQRKAFGEKVFVINRYFMVFLLIDVQK